MSNYRGRRPVVKDICGIKFTQVITEQWTSDKGVLNSNVLALGTDGVVYRFSKTHDGRIELRPTIIEVEQ